MTATTQTLKNDDATTVGTLVMQSVTSPATGNIGITALATVSGATATMVGDSSNPLIVDLGANNDVTLATLPDTSAGDLAAINAALGGTLTVGSHAVTNAGTFVVQVDGTALTRLTDIETNTDFGAVTGGGTEAGALRVTLASDSTGLVSIDDGGGSLTVDGTVTANLGATDNAVLDSIDSAVNGTLTVGSHAVTNAGTFATQIDGDALTALQLIDNPVATISSTDVMRVAIFDASDSQITSFGGGTQYAVDTALGAAPTGTLSVAIRDDALSTLTPVEGDAVGLRVDANGGLWVTPSGTVTVSGTVTANLSATDNAVLDSIDSAVNGTLTVGSHAVTNAGTFAVQVDGDALTALQLIDNPVATISATDVMRVAIFDDSDAQITTFGGGTQYAIDTAAGGTDTGTMALAIRDDSLTTLTPVDGDYVPLRVNSTGALHVTGAGGGTQYQIDDASGATDTGTLSLAIRDDSLTTLTPADGDYVPLRVSSTGALHVTGGGGGTEYSEDVATPGTITGTATVMERDDALSTVTPVEGDWIGLRGSAEGALWTQDFNSDAILTDTNTIASDTTSIDGKITACDTGAVVISSGVVTSITNDVSIDDGGNSITVDGTTRTEYSEDVATPATIVGSAVMMERDDALSTLTPVAGDWASMRCSSAGALWVAVDNIVTTTVSGTVNVDGSGVTQPVSNAGTFAVQLTGDALTALQLIDDALYADDADWFDGTSKHVLTGGLYQSTPQTITDGDVGPFQVTSNGYLITSINGTVTVDGSGVTQPVSGTVTANLSATDNAVLDTIETNTDFGTVTGGGTEAGALRVTLASDSTGTVSVDDNGGSLTVDASQLDIDDLAPTADGVSAALDTSQIMDGTTSLTPKYAVIDDASSGNNTIVAAVAAKKIRVLALFMVAGGDVDVRFEDGAGGTALTGQMDLTTNSGFVLPFNPVGWFETTANTLLNLELSGAVSCDGSLVYVEV